MATDPLERVLAPFSDKGTKLKVLSHCVRNAQGEIVQEGSFDWMEREYRAYDRRGGKDPNSGAEVIGNEEEFVRVAREARDERLVGVASGQVVRAVGSLKEGTGMLLDMYGRQISQGSVQQAPVNRTRRSPRDW